MPTPVIRNAEEVSKKFVASSMSVQYQNIRAAVHIHTIGDYGYGTVAAVEAGARSAHPESKKRSVRTKEIS